MTQKSGVCEKHSVNIIYSLIWVSDSEVLCTQENVSVLNLDSEFVCVHRRWSQSVILFLPGLYGAATPEQLEIALLIMKWIMSHGLTT